MASCHQQDVGMQTFGFQDVALTQSGRVFFGGYFTQVSFF